MLLCSTFDLKTTEQLMNSNVGPAAAGMPSNESCSIEKVHLHS